MGGMYYDFKWIIWHIYRRCRYDQSGYATDSIKYRYKSHLKPVFGNIELEAIDPKSIKKFQKDMVEGVYGSRSGDVFRCHILI